MTGSAPLDAALSARVTHNIAREVNTLLIGGECMAVRVEGALAFSFFQV
jgi:hypothetical protein